MSRAWCLALVLAAAAPAGALSDTRLDLSRRDTHLHMAVAFATSFLGSELLEWRKLPTWKATALSSLAVAAGALLKEFAIDREASGNDLMADGIGLGANAALQFSVRF